MDFHPGGADEILNYAGQGINIFVCFSLIFILSFLDATPGFDEVHAWVNYKSLLKVCLIGQYAGGTSDKLRKQIAAQSDYLAKKGIDG